MNHGATVPPQKDKCASDKQHVLHENGMVYAFQIFFFSHGQLVFYMYLDGWLSKVQRHHLQKNSIQKNV